MKSILLILAVCLPVSLPVRAGGGLSPEQQALNLASFDQVWTTVRDRHFDPSLGGLDWDAIREELRPRVAAAADEEAARGVLQEMLSRLGQSHFNIIPAELYESMALAGGAGSRDGISGLDVLVIKDAALVTRGRDDSPAAQLGIQPGWQVLTIGGEDVAPLLAKIKDRFAGASWRDGVMASVLRQRLAGAPGESIGVTFLDGDGERVDKEITLAAEKGEKRQFGFLPPVHVHMDAHRVDDAIGYVSFNMFLDPSRLMPIYDQAMTDFMSDDGIIIDVRGNPGGLPGMVTGMIGWLARDKTSYLGTMHMRGTELKVIVNRRLETYTGPVAVLVDELSGSAAELFAGGLKDLDRARLFGTRTMGAVLPSVVEALPNGDKFQFAIAGYETCNGETLEGRGVVPHVELKPSRADLLAGRDPVLEAAIAWVHETRKP